MLIGGFQKFSLIDYPGEVAAIVFTSGCNFRCPYCHNPELVNLSISTRRVSAAGGYAISEENILSFLEKRVRKLTAVSITGGEPSIQEDLPEFIKKIKKMGFLVKLDTNGSNPDMLEKLIKNRLIDYVAMDIKAPLSLYEEVAHSDCSSLIKKSIDVIISSLATSNSYLSERNTQANADKLQTGTIDYEFRTTIVKSLLSEYDIIEIGKEISGAASYYLQRFMPSKTLDPMFMNESTYSEAVLKNIAIKLEKHYVHRCSVR